MQAEKPAVWVAGVIQEACAVEIRVAKQRSFCRAGAIAPAFFCAA
jgi:hypothetical protein